MASTGVAAFNINGATIHHELAITTECRHSQPYTNISGEICRRMQEDFKDTMLIIIDEYSVVGRTTLANVDLRCRDMPLAVTIDFDRYRGTSFHEGTHIIPIAPQTSHWKSSFGNISCQRTQIPLIFCKAITILKSQGLTLDRVVVDIGDKGSLGLTFVALCRTRKLCDLAFSPIFTFERLQEIGKCAGLKGRLEEEKYLRVMSSMGF